MSMIIERKEEPKKLSKAEAFKKLEEQREKDHELVSGLFKFDEHKGGTLRFRFKKYAKDNYSQWEFTDGKRYRIPRMIAVHLNTNVHYLSYNHLDKNFAETGATFSAAPTEKSRFADGKAPNNHSMYSIEKVRRCQFIPLEFCADDLGLDDNRIIEMGTGVF